MRRIRPLDRADVHLIAGLYPDDFVGRRRRPKIEKCQRKEIWISIDDVIRGKREVAPRLGTEEVRRFDLLMFTSQASAV